MGTLEKCEFVAKQSTDILECRIEDLLEEVARMPLFDMNHDDAISAEDFSMAVQSQISTAIVELNRWASFDLTDEKNETGEHYIRDWETGASGRKARC